MKKFKSKALLLLAVVSMLAISLFIGIKIGIDSESAKYSNSQKTEQSKETEVLKQEMTLKQTLDNAYKELDLCTKEELDAFGQYNTVMLDLGTYYQTQVVNIHDYKLILTYRAEPKKEAVTCRVDVADYLSPLISESNLVAFNGEDILVTFNTIYFVAREQTGFEDFPIQLFSYNFATKELKLIDKQPLEIEIFLGLLLPSGITYNLTMAGFTCTADCSETLKAVDEIDGVWYYNSTTGEKKHILDTL